MSIRACLQILRQALLQQMKSLKLSLFPTHYPVELIYLLLICRLQLGEAALVLLVELLFLKQLPLLHLFKFARQIRDVGPALLQRNLVLADQITQFLALSGQLPIQAVDFDLFLSVFSIQSLDSLAQLRLLAL